MRRTKRNHKNIVAIIAMAALLTILVVGGTVAWLTRTSSLTNTFTVGSFTTPDTFPVDPEHQDTSAITSISIEGNLYEPSWAGGDHKLIPAATFAKDPYVGIGEGSEDAVVYVNVTNNLSNKVYFTINTGWVAVDGCTTAGYVPEDPEEEITEPRYTSGLFKYTAGLTANSGKDVWTTTPLFSAVLTDESANSEDFTVQGGGDPAIVVTSFLHQAKDGNTPISATEIESAAKKVFHYTN